MRKNVVIESKFGKYLLYALGEIILVVIGILIAIQLNTWKTENDEHVEVLSYIDGLYSELNQDYERMDSLYAFYLDKTNIIQQLLNDNDLIKEQPNEALGTSFNSILEYKKFTNKKSSYLSLINSGYINKIKDKDLTNALIKYYESPYLTWSTEIYESIFESIDYGETDIYNPKDRLIDLNINNAIPNWDMTNQQYHTNYADLVQSKWAIDIFTRLLKQSNYVFANLSTYKEMNNNLRHAFNDYRLMADDN